MCSGPYFRSILSYVPHTDKPVIFAADHDVRTKEGVHWNDTTWLHFLKDHSDWCTGVSCSFSITVILWISCLKWPQFWNQIQKHNACSLKGRQHRRAQWFSNSVLQFLVFHWGIPFRGGGKQEDSKSASLSSIKGSLLLAVSFMRVHSKKQSTDWIRQTWLEIAATLFVQHLRQVT